MSFVFYNIIRDICTNLLFVGFDTAVHRIARLLIVVFQDQVSGEVYVELVIREAPHKLRGTPISIHASGPIFCRIPAVSSSIAHLVPSKPVRLTEAKYSPFI